MSKLWCEWAIGPINWMKIFQNKIGKTKKLMVNKVQLYPLSSLSFNFFYEKKKSKQTIKKERKKGAGPYFKQGSILKMQRIAVSL